MLYIVWSSPGSHTCPTETLDISVKESEFPPAKLETKTTQTTTTTKIATATTSKIGADWNPLFWKAKRLEKWEKEDGGTFGSVVLEKDRDFNPLVRFMIREMMEISAAVERGEISMRDFESSVI